MLPENSPDMKKEGSKKSQAVAILAILSLVTGCSTGHTFKLKNGGVLSIKKDNVGCEEFSTAGLAKCYYGGTVKMPSGAVVDNSAEFSCGAGNPRGDFLHTRPNGYDQFCQLFEEWGLIPPKGTPM